MILPPFFGISSKYNEEQIRAAIIDYLAFDSMAFAKASKDANISFIGLDISTFQTTRPIVNATYLAVDTLSFNKLIPTTNITFNSFDVLTYDPPPEVPEITIFTYILPEDSQVELAWNTPYARRSPITEYILQYSNSFRSNLLAENQLSFITEDNYYLLDEAIIYSKILDDNLNWLLTEDLMPIIEDPSDDYHYRWHTYNQEILLTDRDDRLNTQTFLPLLTEKSFKIGLTNFVIAENLINDQPYIFRIAAVNKVGIGPFGYSNIIVTTGPYHIYCDVLLFIQPDSNVDIFASLVDHSCREKTILYIENVQVSSQSKFGPASLYFDGQFYDLPAPSTYSHLQINNNYANTLDDWSLTGDFTIELWIQPERSSFYIPETLASCYHQNGYDPMNKYSYWKIYKYNNSIRFAMNSDQTIDEYEFGYVSENIELIADNLNLPTNEFTHVAICRFKNYIRLFINGIKYDRKYFDHNVIIDPTNNPYMIIGASQTHNYIVSDEFNSGRGTVNEAYKGHIDDFIFSKSARYTKNFIPQKYLQSSDCSSCLGNTNSNL